MARASYGQQAKKRARLLFEALLAYANDELDCDEALIDGLRPHIQTRWHAENKLENKLVVRTKVRYLSALTATIVPNNPLNAEQIKEALKRFADYLEILEDNRPTRSGSETWHFTLKLWYKNLLANLEKFDQEWEQRHSSKLSPSPQEQKSQAIPVTEWQIEWQNICRNNLEAQHHKRLTTNPLTSMDGVTFELDEVYVPLGLVERKGRERRHNDFAPYEGSRLYEPEDVESTQTFANDEFLQQLLQQQSKRLAILGEPGAGKTTLLQRIAAWILEKTSGLPIWVSLADLQGKTLEEYLIQDWLKNATRKSQISPEMEMEFTTLFNQGRVWLLLDAVDEMAIESTKALAMLATFLKGWVADATIILTCRLNVWDAGKNALENFDTYRNLSFSYGTSYSTLQKSGDLVGEFICRWFKNNPQLGEKLRTELDQGGRGRIKDAVKNPLRLALLCRTWGLTQGSFPNTKAMLYEQFVEAIYEWKQDRFPTTYAQRKQLNKALSELALLAIAQEKTKFRLRHRFVCEVLGEPDDGFFQLALQLGWLNQIGISETMGEKVYAFYHPTFQEYFAAQAIQKWQYFLHYNPDDYTQGIYRIFEPQWREVILLWLGRNDIPQAQKEEFIQALINFQDGCGGYYEYQAYFLAALGIAEFTDCRNADVIVRQLIKWRFGYFDKKIQKWYNYPASIVEGARVALLKTERTKAIAALEEYIQSSENEFYIWNAAYSLGKSFDSQNQVAISVLEKILKTARQENFRWQIAHYLGRVDPLNEAAVTALVEIIKSTKNLSIQRKVAYSLGKIDTSNQLAISTLEKIAETATDASLKRIVSHNLTTLRGMISAASNSNLSAFKFKTPVARQNTPKTYSAPLKAQKVSSLLKGIELAKDDSTRRNKAYKLAQIDPGNSVAFSTLLNIVKSSPDKSLRKRAADNLKEVLLVEQLQEIIISLRDCFENEVNNDVTETLSFCYKLLWHCAENMTYLEFYQVWHS